MHIRFKKFMLFLIVFIMSALLILPALAEENEIPERDPVSPEFLEWLKHREVGNREVKIRSKHSRL